MRQTERLMRSELEKEEGWIQSRLENKALGENGDTEGIKGGSRTKIVWFHANRLVLQMKTQKMSTGQARKGEAKRRGPGKPPPESKQ
jgi:hypothetical protein